MPSVKVRRPTRQVGVTGAGKRLVCVVEGHGEVQALPCLCSRIRDYFEAWSWRVDEEPVRQSRSLLVDERKPSPRRPAHREGMERALRLALARPADAVLVLCDSDDDCAAEWGRSASALIAERCVGGAVMVVREFESWLLCSKIGSQLGSLSVDSIRDARGRLKGLVPGYKPTVHQLQLTRTIDIQALWGASESFDKFMRTLGSIFAVDGLTRPLGIT